MAEEKLLTVRDVSVVLGISEKEVMDLAESGVLPAYKVGGVYLRFKREQVEEHRRQKHALAPVQEVKTSFRDRIIDFFYFNDFYIVAILVILLLLAIIFKG